MLAGPRGLCFDGVMRVLFSTTAGTGHFGPLVPVARACRDAGHTVAVAAPASFAGQVHNAGLTHVALPDTPAEKTAPIFARLPTLPRLEANRLAWSELFGRLHAQTAVMALLEVLPRWRPDVVVREPCEFGSLVAAERLGIPQVQVAIGVSQLLAAAAPWLQDPVAELEARVGLSPPRGVGLLLSQPTLTCVPATFDRARGDSSTEAEGDGRVWRFRSTSPATGPAVPGTWGDPSWPLVYVTFGSVVANHGWFDQLFSAMLEVLAPLPVRVLMTTGTGFEPSRLDPLPSNAWVAPWWPQEAAMAATSVIIGHGGFGTTMIALAAGVPQIVMPLFSFDQFLNAERLQAVGAGVQLPGGLAAVADVPSIVSEFLSTDRYAAVARTIADEIAQLPEVATIVEVIDKLRNDR